MIEKYITLAAFCNKKIEYTLPSLIPDYLIDPRIDFENEHNIFPNEGIIMKEEIAKGTHITTIEIETEDNYADLIMSDLLATEKYIGILKECNDGNKINLSLHSNDNRDGLLLYETDLLYGWDNPYEIEKSQYTTFFRMITPRFQTYNALSSLQLGKRYIKQIELELPLSFKQFL